MANTPSIVVYGLSAALGLAGCQHMSYTQPARFASADMRATSSASAANLNPLGTVRFTELQNGNVRVEARISGLKPNSEHGFHVHAVTDCSGDGAKTGGHFNPDNHAHGNPGEKARHAGALFNLKTDASGVGILLQDVDTISLNDGPYSIVGKPLIIHRDADDYQSQPLGNAGPRVGCGVIASQ